MTHCAWRGPVADPSVRTPILLLATLLGILVGGFAHAIIAGPDPTPAPAIVRQEPASAGTVIVQVQAILTLPSPTPTSPPPPTRTPTRDPAASIALCGTPTPGALCRMPLPTPTFPPSPTPVLACDDPRVQPGDWCVWPDASPAAERSHP